MKSLELNEQTNKEANKQTNYKRINRAQLLSPLLPMKLLIESVPAHMTLGSASMLIDLLQKTAEKRRAEHPKQALLGWHIREYSGYLLVY